jgi:probable phosphoglycerate mutase
MLLIIFWILFLPTQVILLLSNLILKLFGIQNQNSDASWSILERNPRQWNLIEHNAGSIPEPVYGEESGATSA